MKCEDRGRKWEVGGVKIEGGVEKLVRPPEQSHQ
jgi:hypothetical protein